MALVSDLVGRFAAAGKALAGKQVPQRPIQAEVAQSKYANMYGDWLPNPDKVLRDKSQGENFELYHKMLRLDAHLRGVLSHRMRGISSLSWEILPADEKNATAQEHAETVAKLIEQMSNWRDMVEAVAAAPYFGFTVNELMWAIDDDGMIYVAESIDRHQNKFVFTNERELALSTEVTGDYKPILPPPRKLLLAKGDTRGENVYGNPLAESCYWLTWIALEGIKSGAIGTERWGAPVVDATYDGQLTDAEKDEFEDQLDTITTCTSIYHSAKIALQLLESAKAKGAQPFSELIALCEARQSKLLLGQTLTTEQGSVGSYSLGRVHADIEQAIVEADAEATMGVINNGYIRWLCDFNFGPDAMKAVGGYPQYVLHYEPPRDLVAFVDVIERLHKMGLEIPLTYVREQATIPAPNEGEEVLPPYQGQVLPAITETDSTGEDGDPGNEPAKQSAPPSGGSDLLSLANTLTDMFWQKKQANSPESVMVQPQIVQTFADNPRAVLPDKSKKKIEVGKTLTHAPRFERRLRTIYRDLREELRYQASVNDFDGLLDLVDDVVRDQFEAQLARPMSLAVEDTIRETAQKLARQLDSTYNLDTFKALTKGYLKERAYDKGVITELADTLREVLSENITQIIDSGDDLDSMVKALMQSFDGLSEYKAKQIALSECRQAANWATLEMGKRSKLKLEAWFMVDPASCPICQEWASKNPYPLSAAQNSGYPHPGCNDYWAMTKKEGKSQ